MSERITRKFLDALGVADTAKDAIIDAYRDAIDPVLEENKNLKKQLEGIDTTKDWKSEAEKATSALEALKADVASKETRRAKETAYRAILKEAGVANIDRVIELAGNKVDKIELDNDGAPTKKAELVEAAKADWPEFLAKTVTVGANVSHPPANAGKVTTMTKEQIMAIKDSTERRRAIAENGQLFGIND